MQVDLIFFIKLRATDYHSIRSFTVINKNNLNDNPDLSQSHGVSDSKTFCWGPCKTEPIVAKFGIKKGNFKIFYF